MKLVYEGKETIRADYDTVWAFISDPEKVGQSLPDLQKLEVKSDKKFDAWVRVGLGPVRGKFKFNVELVPQPDDQKMVVKLRGGGLGTVVDLEAQADVKQEDDSTTILDWNGEAVVRGPAATVGARVLDKKANELISHVFAEVGRSLNEGNT